MSTSTDCSEKSLTYKVRLWEREDRDTVVLMLEEYLASEFEHGSFILPCRENAEQLWSVGYAAASSGYPTFVAEDEGKPFGFIISAPIVGWMTTAKVMQDMGVFVGEAYRGKGVSGELRRKAQAISKMLGYEVMVGVFYHLEIYPKPETIRDNSVLNNGWKPYGVCGKLEL